MTSFDHARVCPGRFLFVSRFRVGHGHPLPRGERVRVRRKSGGLYELNLLVAGEEPLRSGVLSPAATRQRCSRGVERAADGKRAQSRLSSAPPVTPAFKKKRQHGGRGT